MQHIYTILYYFITCTDSQTARQGGREGLDRQGPEGETNKPSTTITNILKTFAGGGIYAQKLMVVKILKLIENFKPKYLTFLGRYKAPSRAQKLEEQ